MDIPLTDAYTGKTLSVEYVHGLGFVAKGAFSPGGVFDDRVLLDRMLRRRGTTWIPNDAPLKCPYTGKDLTIVEVSGGFSARGGLDPVLPFKDREGAVFALAMRNGVPVAGLSDKAPTMGVGNVTHREAPIEIPQAPKAPRPQFQEAAARVAHAVRKS